MTGPTARAALRDCPKCAEPVPIDGGVCGFCDHPVAPRKSAAVRVLEVTSLALVLAVIILVCRALGTLLGV